MKHATVCQRMPVPAKRVFELLHDYDRRLEWDTLLRRAELTRGHTVAAKGATSLCVGRPCFGVFGLETRYVTFRAGEIAAVELVNRPPLFAEFAASIRHRAEGDGSLATYKLRFAARPRCLAWLLEPIMLWALRAETRRRLAALARFLARQPSTPA